MTAGGETAFVFKEVSEKVHGVIDRVIEKHDYEPSHANRWSASIVDQTLTELAESKKPFKYIVYAVSRVVCGRAIPFTS